MILDLCRIHPLSAVELSEVLKRKNKKSLVRDHLTPMKDNGQLKIDNPISGAVNQKYYTTKTTPKSDFDRAFEKYLKGEDPT